MPVRLYIYHSNQCDPKKCTGKKLARFSMAELVQLAKVKRGSILLTPTSEQAISPADKALAFSKGVTVLDCSWAHFEEACEKMKRKVEGRALTNIFITSKSSRGPLVTAPKALTGHEFWMAGASQVVYGMLMAKNNFIAGNPNLKRPDLSVKHLRLPIERVYNNSRFILCNAAGFGGTNACLVIRNNSS